jgi:hypothetical protein
MVAAPGKADALALALTALAQAVRNLPGEPGVEIVRDCDDAGHFVFRETWPSIEAHKGTAGLLGKELMGPVMAALGQPPQAGYFAAM